MDRESFIEAVRSQAVLAVNLGNPPDPRFIECAIIAAAESIDGGRVYHVDLQSCLVRAIEIYNSTPRKGSKRDRAGRGKREWTVRSGESKLTSLLMRRHIESEVKQSRLLVSDSEDPPFSSWEAALSWIEHQLEGMRSLTDDESSRKNKLSNRIYALADQVTTDFGVFCSVGFEIPMLTYRSGRRTLSRPVYPSSPLRDLVVRVNNLASLTGFTKEDMIEYILVDRLPTLPRVEAKSGPEAGGMFGCRRILIRYNALDITRKELGDTLRLIRTKVDKSLSDPGWILFAELIARLGEPPARQRGVSGNYWQKMLEAWNAEAADFGLSKLTSREALMNRWARRPPALR